MNASHIYMMIVLAALGIIVLVLFWIRGQAQDTRLSPLAGLAFGLVLAGLFFAEHRLVGYGLMGAGLLLAVVDIINRSRKHPFH